MSVVAEAVTDTDASLTLFYQFDGTDPGYPFRYDLSLTYNLSIDHSLTLTAYVFNTMLLTGTAFPFTFGWHPYLMMNDVSQVLLTLDSCVGWNHISMSPGAPMHGNLIPTGFTTPMQGLDGALPIGGSASNPTYYDDEFKATRSPHAHSLCGDLITQFIYDPTTDQTIEFWQDNSYRVAQLFTGSMSLWGSSAIALEPMSGLADAYNNGDGLSIISAGQEWDGSFGIRLL